MKSVLLHYPDVQAVYLFSSYGIEDKWPESDVDIALLLPPEKSKKTGSLAMTNLLIALESLLKKNVDIINLRQVSTVLQKEIVTADRRIYTSDSYATEEFEMLTLSYLRQKHTDYPGRVAFRKVAKVAMPDYSAEHGTGFSLSKPSRDKEAWSFAQAGALKPAHTVGEKGRLHGLCSWRGRRKPL